MTDDTTRKVLPTSTTYYYIGSDECKVASCTRKQAFPQAIDPYCIKHSLEDYYDG